MAYSFYFGFGISEMGIPVIKYRFIKDVSIIFSLRYIYSLEKIWFSEGISFSCCVCGGLEKIQELNFCNRWDGLVQLLLIILYLTVVTIFLRVWVCWFFEF